MNRLIQIIIILLSFFYLLNNFNISNINWELFNIYGLIAVFFLIILGQFILSFRFLKITNISFIASLETITISSFLNMILPAKLGEITKIVYLKKFYRISVNKITAGLFIERFFDIIILTFLMLIFFYFYFQNEILKISILVLLILILLTISFFKFNFFKQMLKKIPIKFIRVYSQKIYINIHKSLKNPYNIILWSIILWSSYFLSIMCFFTYAVDFKLNISQVLELFLFSSIVLSLSITPGSIATYEAAIVFILNKYGIDKENALIAAILYHFILYLVDFLFFSIFLFFKNISIKDIITNNKNGKISQIKKGMK